MKKFLVVYKAPKELMKQAEKTPPEERKKSMELWHQWAKKCGDGLVTLGSPLGNCHKVNQSGLTPGDSEIVGYSILQAENLEKAQEMLNKHPHIQWDNSCDIEVHECLPMPE